MESSFKNSIGQDKSILICLPSDPNFDEVAAGTSLYLALIQEGNKEVNIYSPSPMLVEFNRLIGVNKVKSEIANKNLAISFVDYDPQGIETVSWDIDNNQFVLTIVPKNNITPPQPTQIKTSYSGVAADSIVLIGGKDEESFPALKSDDLKDAKLIHIGVNELKLNNKKVSSFATVKSTISEIIAAVVKASYKLEADIATNLLMGIETGTNEFVSSNVTADTFETVSELMRAGGKRVTQQSQNREFPAGAIPGIPGPVPSSWTENPKIFKGTSVS